MRYSTEARNIRYAAKMASNFVEAVYSAERDSISKVWDPFCGSGEILLGAARRGIPSYGTDVNPYAALLSSVRLCHWKPSKVAAIAEKFFSALSAGDDSLEMEFPGKTYWFPEGTLCKLERMRFVANELALASTIAGRVVLLAITQSVRLVSRADNRSPKPFISKTAIRQKCQTELDPEVFSRDLLESIVRTIYPKTSMAPALISISDCRSSPFREAFSHVITSPPYLNAQDYFRNSLLENHFLNGLLDFRIQSIAGLFLGTERRLSGNLVSNDAQKWLNEIGFPKEPVFSGNSSHRALAIASDYFSGMRAALLTIRASLKKDGVLWIIAGDNILSGVHIPTVRIISNIAASLGFRETYMFLDPIRNRSLAPSRAGHKGIIKNEVATRFTLAN